MKNKILISFIVLITILGCWNFAKAQSFNFWQYSGGALKPAVKTWDVGVTDELRIYDNNHSNYVGFKGANNVTIDQIWVLPTVDSTGTQYLNSDGSGTLSWGAPTGTGANTALSNLSSVAINTSLLSDTADTDSLGSVDKEWLNLYIGDSGKAYFGLGQDVSIYRNAANEMTLTASSGVTTSANLVVTGDLTITGDDIFATTNTTGAIWVGDNTNFNPVVMGGHGSLAANGTLTISDITCTDCLNATEIEDIYVLLAGDTMGGLLTLSGGPTVNLHAATKEYVDLAVGFQFDYFFNNTSAGIGATGYFNMTDTDLGGAETTDLETTITNGVDDQELVEFISLSGQPGIEELSAGVYTFHFHAERTSGNSTVDAIYVELWKYEVSTAETLLGTSELTSEIVQSKESYEIHTSIGSEITLDPTDRLLVKFFANTGSGGGSGSDVEIYAEGNTSSRFSFETTSAILSTLYIRQDGTTAFSGNQDFGTNDITGVGSLTLGTSSSADGTIIFQNATNANTLTIQTGATSGTYVLTLPLSVGGAGEVLTDAAGDGVLSWSAAGSGDVLAVGSCAEGLCLDGTSDGGTDITFYNIDSNKTQLIASDTASDLVITLPATTGILALLDSPTFTTAITVPNDSISAAELNEGDNFTWTGAHIFDGASLELPQDDTTDVVGETQLDTTDTTFIIHDGTANRVFGDDIYQFNFTIYADDAWDDEAVPIWIAPKDMAITIVQVHAATMGTTPSLAYNIEERAKAGLASAGTDIYAADEAADATGEDETSFSNAGIAAGAHLVLTTGSSSETGTVDLITGVVYYRKDVE